MMMRLEREEILSGPYLGLWSVLGFQAGYINAFGFLACGRYVSHVTGVGTQIGMALAAHRPWLALELLGFPLSFVVGSFASSLVTSVRLERGQSPRFDLTAVVISIFLVGLLGLGTAGLFGPFGEELLLTRDFVLLYSLSGICGAQNGCFAVMTKGLIRTTHLTGISTDLGTDLARCWVGRLSEGERYWIVRTNWSRILTVMAFTAGSVVSVILSSRLDYKALLLPLATSLSVLIFFKGRERLTSGALRAAW